MVFIGFINKVHIISIWFRICKLYIRDWWVILLNIYSYAWFKHFFIIQAEEAPVRFNE